MIQRVNYRKMDRYDPSNYPTVESRSMAAPISAADREKAKELYTKATSGPWCAYDYASEGIPEEYCICAVGEIVRGNVTASLRENDAEFIAFARTAVPSYEARVVELEAALAHREKMGSALLKDALRAEDRATALLEALREIDDMAHVPEQDSLIRDSYRAIRRVALAAINAGASNDRK